MKQLNNNKKKIIIFSVVVLLLCTGFYSIPYFSIYRMQKAVENKDITALSSYINFPLLKNNLQTKFIAENQTEEDVHNFANEMLDVLITPENLSTMMKGSMNIFHGRYENFNKFIVRVKKEEQTISFIFYRDGLFAWKLSNLIPQ